MSHADHAPHEAYVEAARLRAASRRRLRRWLARIHPDDESPISKIIRHLMESHVDCYECLERARGLFDQYES